MISLKIIRLYIILIAIILLGGCFVNTNKDNFDDETITAAKNTVESYIRNNYIDIDTVEFDDDDYSSPVGGLMIDGTVNGNAGFSADIDEETFRVRSLGEKTGFPERKEECKKKVCDYKQG